MIQFHLDDIARIDKSKDIGTVEISYFLGLEVGRVIITRPLWV